MNTALVSWCNAFHFHSSLFLTLLNPFDNLGLSLNIGDQQTDAHR